MRPDVVHWLQERLPWQLAEILAPSWFTCVGLAGVVTLLLMIKIGRRHGIDSVTIASVVLWSYIAAVLAGIVMPMLIDAIQQKLTTDHVKLRWAGMTSFWGYLAGFAALVIVCRDHALPVGKLADIAAAPLGVTLMLARIGCFLGGCDYGKVTSVPWAVRFPAGSPAWHDHVRAGWVPSTRGESLPVHPTQLYEALLGLVIVVVTVVAARHPWVRARQGRVALVGIATYAIGRIIVETFRADVSRGIYAGLSSGQIFSMCVLVAIAFSLVVTRRRTLQVAASVASCVLVLASSEHAHAQPAPAQPAPAQPTQQPAPAPQQPQPYPQQPYPQQPYPQQPYPQQPYPQQPYPHQPYPQQPYPPPGYAQYPAPAPAEPQAANDSRSRRHFELGLLAGTAFPMNRRPEQVGVLGGPTVSAGYMFGPAGVWLDFDSYGNADASHGTWLLSGSFTSELRNKLSIGGRIGIGTTLVNFDDPAFQDVSASTFRIEATVDYALGESWAAWLRPMSFDIINAQELGGPITTWQMRIGFAYRFGMRKRAAPQPTYPPAGYPPPTYPPASYPPGGYPPPQQPSPALPPAPQPQPQPQPATPAPTASPQ